MKDHFTQCAVEGHKITLRMLVTLCREQECSDVIDKIFGLLSLLSVKDETDLQFSADYSKTPEEVCSMAVAMVKMEERLHPRNTLELDAELRAAMNLGSNVASISSKRIDDGFIKRTRLNSQQNLWYRLFGA